MAHHAQLPRAVLPVAVVKVGVRAACHDVQLLRRVRGLVDGDRALVGRGEPVVLGHDHVDRHAHLFRCVDRRRHRLERRSQHERLDSRVLGGAQQQAARARRVRVAADVLQVEHLVELAALVELLALHV